MGLLWYETAGSDFLWLYYYAGTARYNYKGDDYLSNLAQYEFGIEADLPFASAVYCGGLLWFETESERTWPNWILSDGNTC